jgi:WD40 repeat protein
LSETAFVLKPDESKIVFFSFNVSEDNALPGEHDFVIMPTLLNTNVEPYLNDFANYVSQTDPFMLNLILPGVSTGPSSEGTPVTFASDDKRSNLPQFSTLSSNNTVLTQLDRAIKLNSPQQAIVGTATSLNVSIFEGLSQQGISLIAVSPNGTLYRVSNSSFTFDREGLWGIMVLMGDEFILGKTVDVVGQGTYAALLAMPDIGTILAAASLLALLAVVPIWILSGKRTEVRDPYSDILFKAYVVRKYISQFDKHRLNRIVQVLKNEYYDLVAQGAIGKKAEAKSSIEELGTLAQLE